MTINLREIALAVLFFLGVSACATHPASAPSAPHVFDASILNRFEGAIAEFEREDAAAMPPPCVTLFVGSSSILFWRSLKEDFPQRKVINRGFGGSTIAEVNHYFDRIVAPYRPGAIVFYAGENDLNAGESPESVAAQFAWFMQQKDQALGRTPVWYISAKPSKLRLAQLPQQTDLNRRIAAMASSRRDLAYIDVVTPMMNPAGTPKDIFVVDGLHMTPEGYAIWTPIVEAALRKGQGTRAPGC
jgi:lysophospholipase L1-like esterase